MKIAGFPEFLMGAAFISLMLSGCASPIAAQGTLVGTLADTAVGSVAARALVESDRRRAARALDSVPDGQPSTWRNAETGVGFVVMPTRTFEQRGMQCRDYTVEATVGGRPDTMSGRACRQADGNWHVSS